MTEAAKTEQENNSMQWFDLSSQGVYLAPEMICGKPCVLLLDAALMFSNIVTQKIALQECGFEPIKFESAIEPQNYLYIKFVENLDSTLFTEKLGIQPDKVRIINKPLLDIQTLLYSLAAECYSFRVDVLIKSSLLLGVNHQGGEVYSSMFGRYKISKTGFNKSELIYSIESLSERNLSYLRANTAQDTLSCCQGYVCDAIDKRRNLSLTDAIRFASILFQNQNEPLNSKSVQPHQVLMVLNAFNLLYIKNILPVGEAEVKRDHFFSNRDNFKKVCLNSEACPSPPRAIYTDYMANQYSTPSPLSFVMQKLLVGDQAVDISENVVDPMFGYGALTNILSIKGMPIIGIEKNAKKVSLVNSIGFDNTRIEVGDSVSTSNLLDFSKDSKPFKYFICNPACSIHPTLHKYEGNDTSFETTRTDFIVLLKSLMVRKDGGRTVFLLPYFNENVEPFFATQEADFKALLGFIHSRYKIEGVASIASEIYSKSLQKICPLLIVIGDKRDNFEVNKVDYLSVALGNPILNYESLWDWSNLICYKRSPASKVDEDTYKLASEIATQIIEESVIITENSNPIDEDEDAFEDFGQQKPKAKPLRSHLSDSNALFGLSGMDVEFEVPEQTTENATSTEITDPLDTEATTQELPLGDEVEPGLKDDASEDEDAINKDAPEDLHSNQFEGQGLPQDADEINEDEPSGESAQQNTEDEADTVLADPELLEEKVSADSDPLTVADVAYPKKDKITKTKGNLFALNEQNKVIRYHSTATLSEPTANVHQSAFGAYLNAKQNLNNRIHQSINKLGVEGAARQRSQQIFTDYQYKFKLPTTVETFIGAHLGLGHPKEWASFFKSEHLDLVASGIFKFIDQRSLVVMDSLGLRSENALAALIEYNRINEKATFIVAQSPLFAESIIKAYSEFYDAALKGKPRLEFVNLSEADTPSAHLKQFNVNKVFVVIADPRKKPTTINTREVHSKYNGNCTVFHETDFGVSKYSSAFLNFLLKQPNLFVSQKFINAETNLKTIQNIFPQNVNSRYFSSGLSELDDMSCYLLKIKMIEDLALFQRYEDLSFVNISRSKENKAWDDKFSILAMSYSSAINNIVLLAEEIQKNNSSRANNLLPKIRQIAIQIYELCTLCITSIPLTHTIFKTVCEQSKPIVVIPKSIENTLFQLLETFEVNLVKSHDTKSVTCETLTELNQYIDQKRRRLDDLGALENTSDAYFEELRDLEDHISVRNHTIFSYLTHSNTGIESKQPDLTSLIAAFYRNCTVGLSDGLDNYGDLMIKANKVEDEINALMEMPLLIIDFIKYELSQHRISSGEISNRSFSIQYAEKGWLVKPSSPCFSLVNAENSKFQIASEFNSGAIDVLFIESDLADGLSLSSIKDLQSNVSDHLRKRVLILTYVNQPIHHYLPLIHLVSDPNQFTPPDLYCEQLLTPVQLAYFNLMVEQLELFNVRYANKSNAYSNISYYLSDVGQKLVCEYLAINPSYLAHIPNLPLQMWTIYNILDIVSMADPNLQRGILDHLNFFARQHLDYLKDIKANPFDLFAVSPKAKIKSEPLDANVLYLNTPLNEDDAGYLGGIKYSTLSYVKNTENQLTLADCSELHKSQKMVEISALKSILSTQFRDNSVAKLENAKHSDWLESYIEHYTKYLIGVFRDKLIGKLHDRFRKWIFTPVVRVSEKTCIEAHFKMGQLLRVSNTLDDLYFELLMLADTALVEDFEKACKVLSFLKAYHLTISRQNTTNDSSPILIPVPSPFNDKTTQVMEGFLMRINFPTSAMICLSPKSFSLSIAYPSKSKPIELNLAYVLEHHQVLDGQSVLSVISESKQAAILKAYKPCSFKDLLTQKIRDFDPLKITGFTDFAALNQHEHHPTIRAFQAKKNPFKLRYMEVLHGNLFDAYYFLRRLIPLTMISFTNENGLAEPGFVISPDVIKEAVSTHLMRTTMLQNVLKVLRFVGQQKIRHYLSTIQWHGESGMLEVGYINNEKVELNFVGRPSQLQKVFLNKSLFKEYPVISSEVVDVVDMMEGLDQNASNNSFTPLSLDGIECTQRGDKLSYKFKIPYSQLDSLAGIIEKNSIYSIALIDFRENSSRKDLVNYVSKSGS